MSFHGSNDPTNSVKALKEDTELENRTLFELHTSGNDVRLLLNATPLVLANLISCIRGAHKRVRCHQLYLSRSNVKVKYSYFDSSYRTN